MRKLAKGERWLQPSVLLAITLLFGALVVRAYWLNTTNQRLCGVLYSLVARSGANVGKPGTPGYAYYHAHPEELRLARKQNQDFLNQLPCKGG